MPGTADLESAPLRHTTTDRLRLMIKHNNVFADECDDVALALQALGLNPSDPDADHPLIDLRRHCLAVLSTRQRHCLSQQGAQAVVGRGHYAGVNRLTLFHVECHYWIPRSSIGNTISLASADIRQFTLDIFSDEDFEVFCSDYFRDARAELSAGMILRIKALRLIEYCKKRSNVDALLAALQKERP